MNKNNMPQFINDLINYLIGIKNLSAIYVNNMVVTIEQFLEFKNTHKLKNRYDKIEKFTLNDLRTITNSDIYSFIFFLAENHYKLNSRVVKTEHLRTFFDYLFRIKHTLFKEPFKKIKCERKVEQKLPNYLSLEEGQNVLNSYNMCIYKNNIKIKAILHLFYKENYKISDIVKLNISDFNPLKTNLSNELQEYLKMRKEIKIESDALFINNSNERISRYTIANIVNEPLKLKYNNKKITNSSIFIKSFTSKEIDDILNNYILNNKITDIRNNAILHLFLNCGLRLSEVSNLNIDDIELNENRFRIIGKGNKERTGYLNENTKKALEDYLNIRKNITTETNSLFLSNYNKRISATTIRRIVKIAYLLANIENETYSVHTLRHTCATLLYRAGIHIKTIQTLLGHVRIDTTEIYTHLYNKDVEDAMLGHPLSKFKIANALAFVC